MDQKLNSDIEKETFDLSNYLIEISKIRRKKFNFSIIKKKLSISDKQLELLELGNIDFYRFHIIIISQNNMLRMSLLKMFSKSKNFF